MTTDMDEKGFWGWVKDHWEAVTAASAVILFYVAKTQSALTALRKAGAWLVMFFGAAKRVMDTLAAQNVQLARIEAELRPNGGSSLRDSVEATRRLVAIASARSRFIVSNSRHAVYECSPDGKCTWVSPALAAMFGMSAEAMLGFGWMQAIKESDVARVQETWARSMRDGIPYECGYMVVHRDTRSEYNCHTSAQSVMDGGKVVGYLGTVEYR